jgi:hypothetical protein
MNKVKGDVFIGVLRLAASKWGADGLVRIGRDPKDYAAEQWYPYEDFCDILLGVKSLARGNPMIIYQLGFNIVKIDPRWQEIFSSKNPAEVFVTTKRQDSQYIVGEYSALMKGAKHVEVRVRCPGCRPEWCEFYRGRLQGVLELTGRTGVVHLQPGKPADDARTYDIKWG